MDQIVSAAVCLTKLNKHTPVEVTTNMIRVNGTNPGVSREESHGDGDRNDYLSSYKNVSPVAGRTAKLTRKLSSTFVGETLVKRWQKWNGFK